MVNKALCWHYPYDEATSLAAKVSVSELKGRPVLSSATDQDTDDGLQYLLPPSAERPRFVSGKSSITAVEHGSAVHLVLEHLDLSRPLTVADINQQIEDLVAQEFLDEELARTIDTAALAAFFAGPLGRRLSARPDLVWREVPFSLILPAAKAYPREQLSPATAAEPILVQGIIDCLVREDNGWLLIDFKTDRARGTALAQRLDSYKHQIKLYAQALMSFSSQPVAEAYLYFLNTGQTVPVVLDLLTPMQ